MSTQFPPHRGTLVLDTSPLINLSHPINPDYLQPAFRHQDLLEADVLGFLGLHGFRLLVPEMVSYEFAGVVRDGTSTGVIFDGKKMDGVKPRRRFINKACHDYGLIIVPPAKDDASPSARFINEVWQTHNDRQRVSVWAGGNIVKRRDHSSLAIRHRRMLMSAQATKEGHRDLGEQAAFNLIRSLQPVDGPITFVSNDKKALKQAGKMTGVTTLSASGLLSAMWAKNLLPYTGLEPSACEMFLVDYIRRTHGSRPDIDGIIQRYRTNSGRNGNVFARQLSGIKEEIQAVPSPTRVSDGKAANRFAARYGNLFPAATRA